MLNRLSNRAIVKVAALGVVLLATLLLASTISALEARSYRYQENGTDPIATFRATTDVEWTVSGADADDFDISSSGVLSFKSTPNYEMGRAGDLNNDGDWDDTGETEPATNALKNTYMVDVVASGTTLVNATVTVLDVDDPGKVTLDHLQPAAGVEFTATVSDEDDHTGPTATPNSDTTWIWERSQNGTSGWSAISTEVKASYTPATADVGYYLRATATYSDRNADPAVPNAPIRTAFKRSDYSVKAMTNTNQAPAFPDGDEDVDDKQQDRAVAENDKDAMVGAAVGARDAGDVLEYTWADLDTVDGVSADDRDEFNIDAMTGQISVKGMLNHEDTEDNDGMRDVYVTATDPFRASDTVHVRITVDDVNDAPTFADAPDGGSVRGVVAEDADTSAAVTPSDDPATTDETEAFDYGASDEDMVGNPAALEAVTYHVGGDDAGDFQIVEATGVLTFKVNTDLNYEKKDSYSVTVIARDARGKTAERDVTIKVTNAEDQGKITLSTRQPQVGVPITASLTDEDGVQGSITWQWGTGTGADCKTLTYTAIDDDRARKPTFEPTDAEVNTGTDAAFAANCINVTATYTDGYNTDPLNPAANDPLPQAADNPVLPKRQANRAPEFENEDGDVITSTTRSVDEDATRVGTAVSAVDPDDAGNGPDGDPDIALSDNLTYSLHGTDMASFTINDDTGQITAKSDTLDYETKKTHSVIVRATDGSRATTDISVTINVTDVNEEPDVNGPAEVTFAENGMGDLGTYTADDPESDAVAWSLRGADAGKFSIPGGVLSFDNPPNYDTAGDEDGNNTYEVTVVATDTVDNEGTKNVEVTVTNEDDLGSISFNVVQPGVGVEITATLNDQDVADEKEGATFQWARGDSASGPFTNIENATEATYTPNSADADKFLQVTATYGAEDNPKSVPGGFDHATAEVDVANPVPVFPDQNLVTDDKETDQEREVAENSAAGTAVGDPVTATDDDVLTYSIHDNNTGDTRDDSAYFSINKASGQISVKSAGAVSGRLDYENVAGTATDVRNLYVVTVRATDANDAMADVKVTIIVTDVDEKPSLSTPANGAVDNVFAAAENQKAIDADDATVESDPTDYQAAKYTATEQDANDSVSWSVEGADGDKFTISGGTLAFDKAPDFEAKGSAAGTNKYKVTIVASDQAGNRSTKSATVNVTNVNEDGSIKLSTVQPQVGVPITATLTDPDGIVGTPTWTWNQGAGGVVAGANKATFTPTTGDGTLVVTVSYQDGEVGADGTAQDVAAADISITYEIRVKQTSNSSPEFQDDEDNKITTMVREIEENAGDNAAVGAVVAATDADAVTDSTNRLTYTLGGPDAASFTINRGAPGTNGADADPDPDNAGQISAKKSLDYETKNVYMVTVTATDGSGASASIDVTINVTDVTNEPPVLAPANEAPEFAGATATREVAEDAAMGAAVGDPVAATDADDDTLTYSISGDSFTIDSATGQIMLGPELDYETTASYTVTVTADDGNGGTASVEVAIMVTDVDEDGSITFDITQLSIGTPITATLTDPDGGVTNVTWMWERVDGQGTATVIADAVSATYMPVNADGGHNLKVTASYDDRQGTGKSAAGTAGEVPEMPSYDADADGDGMISRDEAITAVQDYFRNEITRDQVLAVIAEYFAGLSS